jgi:hypothetical protein
MSSQGPTINFSTLPKLYNGIATNLSGGTQISTIYSVSQNGLRDSSDWIQYKKRLLVVKENKARAYQDQGYLHGNNYRLDFLGGRVQVPDATCNACDGNAYKGSGPF